MAEPLPLRVLCRDAESVVLAEVSARPTPYLALLEVRRHVAGRSLSGTVRVYVNAGIDCPPPAEYEPGSRVVAFLQSLTEDEEGEARRQGLLSGGPLLSTLGGLFGAKAVGDDGDVFSARVAEGAAILLLTDQEERRRRLSEWYVRLVEEPATRIEGVGDLMLEGSAPHLFGESLDAIVPHLTKAQLRRLLDALLTTWPMPRPHEWLKGGRVQLASVVARRLDDDRARELANGLDADWKTKPTAAEGFAAGLALGRYLAHVEPLVDALPE